MLPVLQKKPSRHVSGSAQGAAGTVAARFFLENGEQKHAKDFEAAKEQCRIDNHGQNVNT
ncbi:transposase [Escherichia coli]|uniref:Transposase n=1 Tax=Escherichia coli TaxID=562 RepID=A0AAX0K693_ECOLX|nr:transposase [Escherichia coli]